ncbi:MAG TPA: lysophospholipid acyltransferase family protein [Acidimicrobiales bacterium]|nr:lysophospholipid acyltransferase family protein [Acidimicrobiales bacterium]
MGYWVARCLFTPVLLVLYRVRPSGRANLPRRGPVILASNHQSFMDSMFIPLCVARRVTFLAKAEYFDNPRTAWFFRAMGQIPIRRDGGSQSAAGALAAAREVLDAGGILAIYPEGTRSPDGRLYRGHTGVARIALTCGVPVVPVACAGTAAVQPIGARRPRLWKHVAVRFGPPLRFDDPPGSADDLAVLRRVTERIMEAIAALSGEERVDAYAKRRWEGDHWVADLPASPPPAGAGGELPQR